MKAAKKSHRRLAKSVRKKNVKFEKATPAERRVMIAKDVMESIRARTIVPTKGYYVHSDDLYKSIKHRANVRPKTQVKSLLSKLPTCSCCARGAIFVCAVKRFNDLSCGQAWNSITDGDNQQLSLIRSAEDKYFSEKQLAMIECAFEGKECDTARAKLDSLILDRLYSFRMRVNDSFNESRLKGMIVDWYSELMTAIMQNIVENKGEFLPAPSGI